MRVIDRLDKYIEVKKINDNQITVNCGLSVGLLGKARQGKSDIGKKAIDKILIFYQDLNRVWLLTGFGEMLRSGDQNEEKSTFVQKKSSSDEESYLKKLVLSYEKQLEFQAKEIERLTDETVRLKEKLSKLKCKEAKPEKVKKGEV